MHTSLPVPRQSDVARLALCWKGEGPHRHPGNVTIAGRGPS